MSEPKRIQRQRTKGWRMPAGAVYVGRPTRWGNEWAVGETVNLNVGGTPSTFVVHDRQHAVDLFCNWQVKTLSVHELRGFDLACWCPLGSPCHGDVLLRLANA